MKLLAVRVRNSSCRPGGIFTTWEKAQEHADELFKLIGGTKPKWDNRETERVGVNNLAEIVIDYWEVDRGLRNGKYQIL